MEPTNEEIFDEDVVDPLKEYRLTVKLINKLYSKRARKQNNGCNDRLSNLNHIFGGN